MRNDDFEVLFHLNKLNVSVNDFMFREKKILNHEEVFNAKIFIIKAYPSWEFRCETLLIRVSATTANRVKSNNNNDSIMVTFLCRCEAISYT